MKKGEEGNLTARPADSLDACGQVHDEQYAHANRLEQQGKFEEAQRIRYEADLKFIKQVEELPNDPSKWEKRPPVEKQWDAMWYRIGAPLLFRWLAWNNELSGETGNAGVDE